jgi:hypothetical protein
MARYEVTTTDDEIDALIEKGIALADEPRIVEAVCHPEPGLEFLMLKLNGGRRLLVPREDLWELKTATPEQARDLSIGPNGVDLWWPQLDNGIYLPNFLEYRWRRQVNSAAPRMQEVAA